MKAFLILEDGHVFEGKSVGSTKEIISEIVFNTSMTGYLEVLTDPSYAGQSVCMTYPLIGNYGICKEDMEAERPWQSGFIVRELAKRPSNFRSEESVESFLIENDITGIEAIDTRALTKILRDKGTMKGMITTDEPGFYEEGGYGIRIENELLCVEAEKTEYGQYYQFQNLTFAPIDLDAVLPDMMTDKERDWLNTYHRQVYDTLSPYLDDKEKEWLQYETRAI